MIKESFQIKGKTEDFIDKRESLRIGLQMVWAQNLSTYPLSSLLLFLNHLIEKFRKLQEEKNNLLFLSDWGIEN